MCGSVCQCVLVYVCVCMCVSVYVTVRESVCKCLLYGVYLFEYILRL